MGQGRVTGSTSWRMTPFQPDRSGQVPLRQRHLDKDSKEVLTGAQALRRRPRDRFEAGVEPGEWGEWEPEVTSGAGDGRGSG